MESTALTALRTASEGLVYPSETDAPFEAFSWGKAAGALTPAKAARLAGAPAKAPVAEQSPAEFFAELTGEGSTNADQYRELQRVVGEQLSGARVFRVGAGTIDVYLVGKTRDGRWAGLKTRSVET